MSVVPPPPGSWPDPGPTPAPPPPPAPSAPRGRRRWWLVGTGIAVAVLGLVGGLVALAVGQSRQEDAIRALARAPAGCDTHLEFSGTGTYQLYVETTGTIGDLGGSCANDDRDYESSADDPEVDVVLLDGDQQALDLDRASGISYDAAGFVGAVRWSVEIEEPGGYEVQVRSDDPDVVIAVGRDLDAVTDDAQRTALLIGLAGLVLGAVLIALGLLRRRPPGAAGASPSNEVPVDVPPTTFAAPAAATGWGPPGGAIVPPGQPGDVTGDAGP